MYYIGYTSCISGGDEDTNLIYEYLEWNYAAEDDEEDVIEYPLGYFFSGDSEDDDYIITAPADQVNRQLMAQYPSEVIHRSAIMRYFDEDENARANQMWIDVRCFNIKRVPVVAWVLIAVVICGLIALSIRKKLSRRY